MDQRTRRFKRREHQEEELRLDDVLEPYEQEEQLDYEENGQAFEPYDEDQPSYGQDQPPYDGDQTSYANPYGEEHSDYHEAMDEAMNQAGRFRVAMGVFDTVSILVGIGVILLLVAMLVSLIGWLRSDILHSALLLQSGLQ